MELVKRRLIALLMTAAVGLASVPASAEEILDDQINERPTTLAMMGDAVLARPMLLAITTLGAGLFLVTLPFSALGGNVKEAANTLVIGPGKSTFTRCLGCTEVQDEWNDRQQAISASGTASN
ncbi:MAG: hypothetical protein ACRERR_09185 [Moraxellaceae bacterium]